jgi:hypothetical protein
MTMSANETDITDLLAELTDEEVQLALIEHEAWVKACREEIATRLGAWLEVMKPDPQWEGHPRANEYD